MSNQRYTVGEVCEQVGVERGFVVHCLRARWVTPAFPSEAELDAHDVARIKLIVMLQEDLGVNEEAIPVLLHLLDQLHALHGNENSPGRKASGLIE